MTLTRIGLIGGTSWQSTAAYYRLLNEAVNARVGGSASAAVTIWSVNFAEIVTLQEADDWPGQGRILADAAKGLEHSGAQAIAVAANTLHLVADDITAAITVPFVDIVDVARAAATARGIRRVGLLATGYTMRSSLFPDRFAADGIEVIVPDSEGQQAIHEVIYGELQFGIIRDESRRLYLDQIDKLAANGADAVLLACTEIEMLLRDGDASVPLLDTTLLHCAALTNVIIDGAKT